MEYARLDENLELHHRGTSAREDSFRSSGGSTEESMSTDGEETSSSSGEERCIRRLNHTTSRDAVEGDGRRDGLVIHPTTVSPLHNVALPPNQHTNYERCQLQHYHTERMLTVNNNALCLENSQSGNQAQYFDKMVYHGIDDDYYRNEPRYIFAFKYTKNSTERSYVVVKSVYFEEETAETDAHAQATKKQYRPLLEPGYTKVICPRGGSLKTSSQPCFFYHKEVDGASLLCNLESTVRPGNFLCYVEGELIFMEKPSDENCPENLAFLFRVILA